MDIISIVVFCLALKRLLIIPRSGLNNEFLIGYFFEIYMLIISHNTIRDMIFIFFENKTMRLFLF